MPGMDRVRVDAEFLGDEFIVRPYIGHRLFITVETGNAPILDPGENGRIYTQRRRFVGLGTCRREVSGQRHFPENVEAMTGCGTPMGNRLTFTSPAFSRSRSITVPDKSVPRGHVTEIRSAASSTSLTASLRSRNT